MVRLISDAAVLLARLGLLSGLGLVPMSLLLRKIGLRKATSVEKSCRCSFLWLSFQALLVECEASGDVLSSFRSVFSVGVCSFRVCLFRECWCRFPLSRSFWCPFRVFLFRVSFSCSFRVSLRVLFLFRVFRFPESWYWLSGWAYGSASGLGKASASACVSSRALRFSSSSSGPVLSSERWHL